MALSINSQESGSAGHRGTVSGTPITWSFTNTSGDLLIVAVIATCVAGSTTSIDAVSYGGTSILANVAVTFQWDTNASVVTLFYFANPPTGSNTVSVTASTGSGSNFAVLAGAISFAGANTGAPIGTTSTNTGTGSTHATAGSITATSGNYLLGVGGWGSGTAPTADGGQSMSFSLVGSGNTGGDDIACVDQQSSGAGINLGFTWSGSDTFGMAAAEIKAAAGGDTLMAQAVM